MALIDPLNGVLSVKAFHEKAGRSQVSSFFWDKGFSPAESATVAMLPFALSRERLVRSGAVWAFSVQPVLPSDWRPVVLPCVRVEPGPGH